MLSYETFVDTDTWISIYMTIYFVSFNVLWFDCVLFGAGFII